MLGSRRRGVLVLVFVAGAAVGCLATFTLQAPELKSLHEYKEDKEQAAVKQLDELLADQRRASEPYWHLIDLAKQVREADTQHSERLGFFLWDYAVTLEQWQPRDGVADQRYMIPRKFWNRWVYYTVQASDYISLDGSPSRDYDIRVMFLGGKDEGGKIHLRSISWYPPS